MLDLLDGGEAEAAARGAQHAQVHAHGLVPVLAHRHVAELAVNTHMCVWLWLHVCVSECAKREMLLP